MACTRISQGKGVCGQAVNRKQTVIVEDVNEFPGHISCDSESKSEIVVPIIKNGSVKGVLDIDSYEYSAFNETDKVYLEDLIHNILYIF
jgi:GAF domain-containing protein